MAIDRAIPYGRQEITQEDTAAVIDVLKNDFLTQGPRIGDFERAFADYVGASFAIAVSNGTAALHLSTMALGVNEKSRVLTTPITFAASANSVLYCGGRVEFIDIDPRTALIDLDKVEQTLERSPKGTFAGIIPVDFAGAAVDMERCRLLADRYGLWIVEDACHAPGGFFVDRSGKRQLCGNCRFSETAIFSFHPVKHIACGEGGMITTNDPALYDKLVRLRTHGITKDPKFLDECEGGWYYEMLELGYNYRLSDIHAALGLSQMGRAEQGLARRRAIANRYDSALLGSEVQPVAPRLPGHAYHLYVIRTPRRRELYEHLRAKNVFCQVHYIPVYKLPYYSKNGYSEVNCPHAEAFYSECLSLPMFPGLADSEIDYVIDLIRGFHEKN